MPLQQFTDAELHAKAVELGLIYESQELPRNLRSRMAAALLEERRAVARHEQPDEPVCAKEIVVQPGGVILIDGEPFPWLVAKEPIQVGLNPDGISTVRLTLFAEAVQIIKPAAERESE